MSVIHVTDDTFEAEVVKSSVPVLIDFWAQWCGPCRMVAPLIDEIAQEYDGRAKIAKLDVDANPKKALEYKVLSIPCMKFLKNGKVVDEVIGAVPKAEITKRLDKLL